MPEPAFIVITGGPGAGKTSMIETLARAGFTIVAEAGRRVIRDQQAAGGGALPWTDPLAFAEAMLARDIAAYESHRHARGPVFFDRGIPDVIGYLRLEGLAVPKHMLRAARTLRYRPRVLICPPWPAIYATDSERRQTPDIAARTYDAMVAVYTALDYELIEMPRVSIAERARFAREACRLP
jgi:predicted ATPase